MPPAGHDIIMQTSRFDHETRISAHCLAGLCGNIPEQTVKQTAFKQTLHPLNAAVKRAVGQKLGLSKGR